ncbi:hypothetical protein [Labrys monachus]|uniref:Uncharacterized protein n=1 Tax=Labrys monachus TaxID=217067 RepID=A0ABU0FEZ0_9HYPH|nr:hypothetical protein [Labrys monachus]MDQ0392714.1 hypothetical protein [Labrys monachus]
MKTIFCSALIVFGCALPLSPAFAISNSPQGAVIVGGGEAPWFGSDTASEPSQARFLSGDQSSDMPAVHHRRVPVRHHIVCDR